MRPLEREYCERNTRLLTSGQGSNHLQAIGDSSQPARLHVMVLDPVPSHAANLEVAQVAAVLLLSLSRELRCKELHRRHRRYEVVDMVLREVANPQASILADMASHRLQFSDE